MIEFQTLKRFQWSATSTQGSDISVGRENQLREKNPPASEKNDRYFFLA